MKPWLLAQTNPERNEGSPLKEVFISYKTEDSQRANSIRSLLEENGITCWMGDKDIHATKIYTEDITKAIQKCAVFILVLSRLAQESTHVHSELECAIHYKKKILPVIIENFRIEEKFEYHIRHRQKIKAYEDWKEAQQEILSTVQHLLSAIDIEQPSIDDKKTFAMARSESGDYKKPIRNDDRIVDVRYGKNRIPVKVADDGHYQILCLHCEEAELSNKDYTKANKIWDDMAAQTLAVVLLVSVIGVLASFPSFFNDDLVTVSRFGLLTYRNPCFWGIFVVLVFLFAPKVHRWIRKKYVRVYLPQYTPDICSQKLFCKKCGKTFVVRIPNPERKKYFYMDSESNQRHEIE